jgi:putative membrane protein
MILCGRPSGLHLFLALRGSVLPRILPALLVNIAIATRRRWRQSMTA